MEKQRVYFVIDMKSFFASVECAERGLDAMSTNLVVADESRTEATICLAVSPAMKSLGVKNRCRLFEIPKNIDFIIAPPRMKKYQEYAAEIYSIYLKYIDKNDIHVYSIDECFLDVTDYLKIYNIKAKDFAIKLMTEIYDTLKISSTVGIGTNLYLAKIALDITAKHSKDRIGWLNEEKFVRTLSKHKPLTDFWGISHGIASRLEKLGITDMEGIRNASEDVLYREFGINAELLIDHSKGIETCLMSDIKNYKRKSKSMSSSQILLCNYNYKEAQLILKEMIQTGCYNLYKQHYVAQLLKIFIGYGDKRNECAKGSKRMNVTSNLYSVIEPFVLKLYSEIVDRNRPIRQIGYEFSDLLTVDNEQYDMFTDYEQIKKEKRLVESILALQDKYGKNTILKGLDLEEKATQRERNRSIGGHKSGEN